MDIGFFMLLLCAICASTEASTGSFTVIGQNVTIDPTAQIHDYVSIGSHSSIGANSQVDDYSNVGEYCNIENDVFVHKYVKIGNGVKIRPSCNLIDYVGVGDKVEISKTVTVNRYAQINENAKIGEGAALDEYSHVFSGVELKEKAYIGKYASIQSTIGASAVIHDYVEILSGETVLQNQVVIRRPSSYDLYRSCAQFSNIQSNDIEAAKSDDRLNERLGQLIGSQMSNLNDICTSGKIPRTLDLLPVIKSLYLINFHGLDRFKEYKPQADSEPGTCSSLRKLLDNEFHFDGTSKDILKPEIKQKFIQLLAIELDIRRTLRVESDTVCLMSNQIQQGSREVKCHDRGGTQCGGANSNANLNIFLAFFAIFLQFLCLSK